MNESMITLKFRPQARKRMPRAAVVLPFPSPVKRSTSGVCFGTGIYCGRLAPESGADERGESLVGAMRTDNRERCVLFPEKIIDDTGQVLGGHAVDARNDRLRTE